MAVITKVNMGRLATLIGSSYQSILDAYGDYDTNSTAVNLIGKSKVFVRGGAEAINGVRETEVGGTGTTLDLLPTYSSKTITVRRGDFYLDGERQSLKSNRSFNFAAAGLLPAQWWYGAGYDDDDDAALQVLAKHIQRTKALIYASNDTINTTTHPGATDMVSGEVYNTTHADFRLDGTTDILAAPFAAPTANVYLDKVQLYLSTNATGTAPNTGLYLYVYANNAGAAPDEPDETTIAATSLKVNDVDSAGGWVDFIFDAEIILTGAASYWLALKSDSPDDGSASNLSATIYYAWHYDSATGGNDVADGTSFLVFTDDLGTTWTQHVDKLPAARYIEYLKVKYTAVAAAAEAENAINLPDATTTTDSMAVVDPTTSHTKIALLDLYSPAADPASGADINAFGTSATSSLLTDVREVVAYEGLEDDDQMSVIFPALNTTENEIITIANEDSTSPVASDFSSVCSGLATHISSTASGYTFKSYWKAQELYMARTFRKVWDFNQSEELSARYGTFSPDGNGPAIFASPIDTRWVSDATYNADISSGVSLEIYMPTVGGDITSDTDMYVYGTTVSYTTLTSPAAIGVGQLSVSNPDIFEANDYLWVETWGGTNGEMLKVSAVSGNIITLAAEANVVGATTIATHYRYDRVWLVEKLTAAFTTTTGTSGASATLTSADSNTFVGVAYMQPQSGATNPGTSGDSIEVRGV